MQGLYDIVRNLFQANYWRFGGQSDKIGLWHWPRVKTNLINVVLWQIQLDSAFSIDYASCLPLIETVA